MGESYHLAMQFMATGTNSIEEQLAQMNEAITMLTRTVEEKKMQIVTLLSKLESHNDKEVNPDPKKNDNPLNEESVEEEPIHENKADTSMGSLSIKQLQDMITNKIKAQYAGTSQDTLMYSKPYTRQIDYLQMPVGYQPPKFLQFDKKGNLK